MKKATIRKKRIVQNQGIRKVEREVAFYNLEGDKVRNQDVTVAKNYLIETELDDLNRIVTMLDYAESQARSHQVMYMI